MTPSEMGRKGGKARTAKKAAAARRNLAQWRERMRKEKEKK